MGMAPAGSEMLGAAAGEKGLEYAIAHLGIDTAGAVVEHKHNKDLQMKAEYKLMKEHVRFCVCGFPINVEANFCSGKVAAEGSGVGTEGRMMMQRWLWGMMTAGAAGLLLGQRG